jgi:hypothetical protein
MRPQYQHRSASREAAFRERGRALGADYAADQAVELGGDPMSMPDLWGTV